MVIGDDGDAGRRLFESRRLALANSGHGQDHPEHSHYRRGAHRRHRHRAGTGDRVLTRDPSRAIGRAGKRDRAWKPGGAERILDRVTHRVNVLIRGALELVDRHSATGTQR